MIRNETWVQPAAGRIATVLHLAMADQRYTELDAAVAYVTMSGVEELRRGHSADLDRLDRRWLSSFDWCRSDPVALRALDQPTRSGVRIFEGRSVVKRDRCTPSVPFHPKGFIFAGDGARLLISGSGNLSRSGITRGIELDTLIEVQDPGTKVEVAAWDAIEATRTWFDSAWAAADKYPSLHGPYQAAFAATAATPPPTDDDWSTARPARRGYNAADLVKIRRATVFWTEAGNLTQNLGKGNPGSQLMTRGLTRVFFGFQPRDVPKQTPIGSISVRYGGTLTTGLSIEYAHNGMDRLNLPRPSIAGPAKYDQETLVFEKVAYRGGFIYELRLASSSAEKRHLKRRSDAAAATFTMPGKSRKFGFCSA